MHFYPIFPRDLCRTQSEAFPEPLKYWKRMSDNRVIDESEKYRIQTYQDG